MILSNVTQISADEMFSLNFDALVVASGYESRARHVAQQLQVTDGQRRVAMGFNDHKEYAREDNDCELEARGFELMAFDGADRVAVIDLMASLLASQNKDSIDLLIDYSCMTRTWYAAMLEAIRTSRNAGVTTVNAYFAYSAPQFTEPPPRTLNQVMQPIRGFGGLSSPFQRTALVLGLGYEPERAQGLHDYLEPPDAYAFYTDPSFDERFTDIVMQSNEHLLTKRLEDDSVFTYPAPSLQIAGCLLTPLCLRLSREENRVILAPLGPKPFCLLCLLLATKFRELEVWRVSAAERTPPVDKKAMGPIVGCKATFEMG